MSFFETIKRSLAACLYYPNQTYFSSLGRLAIICMQLLALFSFSMHLLYEVVNMNEYAIMGFLFTTTFGVLFSFIHTSIKTATIFEFIDNDCGEIIRKSE